MDYATPQKPLPLSKWATASLIAPLLYRLAIWAWPGENYHLFSTVHSLRLQMALNLLIHSGPYLLFASWGIKPTIYPSRATDPRSPLVAFAGIAISFAMACIFGYAVCREYLGYL